MNDIDNPPAFLTTYATGNEGMTLRDYFAAAAVLGATQSI